jgi:DNA-binding NarL/FixJ family response regulator
VHPRARRGRPPDGTPTASELSADGGDTGDEWVEPVIGGRLPSADPGSMPSLIRAVVVDDHPAMRAGMAAVLDNAPDMQAAGQAASGAELWPLIQRTAPDVVLTDWHLPGDDGLVLCHRVKRRYPGIRVVMFSAYADEWLIVPALLAQADALLAKRAPAATLYETVRSVMEGTPPVVAVRPDLREQAFSVLDPEDVGIAGLLLLRTPLPEIGQRTGLASSDLSERVEHILSAVSAAHGPGVTFDRAP